MRLDMMFLIIPVLLWGVSYVAIKIVLDELSPVAMISARFALAAPTLWLIARFKRLPLYPIPEPRTLALGGLLIFLHFWVMAVGMQETSASNTAWILTTAPIFIALLSWIALREPLNVYQWIGLIISCAGVLLLAYDGDPANLSWGNSRGDFIVLGSCITWAIYTIGTRSLTKRVHPLVATFWMTALAGVVFVPYSLFTSGISVYANLSSGGAIALIFLAVGCLAIAFWLWSEGLARGTAAEVGLWLYVEPLVTVIAAWILLGEPLTAWLWLGALVITAGVYIAERYGSTRPIEHDA